MSSQGPLHGEAFPKLKLLDLRGNPLPLVARGRLYASRLWRTKIVT